MPKLERFPAMVRAVAPVDKIARQVVKQRVQAAAWYWKRVAQRHSPRVEDIHQLRVWSRRAIAAIELFRSRLPESPAQDLIRLLNKARKRAGQVRDGDVLVAKLDKQTRKAVRVTLNERREQAAERLRRSYAKKVKSGQLRDLTKAALKLADSEPVPLGDWFHQEFAAASTPFRQQLKVARWNPRNVHTLRIAGKRVRYALEIGLPALAKQTGRPLYAALEAFQKELGAICDDLALSEQLLELARGSSDPSERRHLALAVKRHQAKAKAGLAEFGHWWKSAERRALLQLLDLNGASPAKPAKKPAPKQAARKKSSREKVSRKATRPSPKKASKSS